MYNYLSAIAFAALWTAGVYWWSAPLTSGRGMLLMIAGMLTGLGFYWLTGRWQHPQSVDK